MSTQEIPRVSLKSKFRGCLAGVLLGDCIGNLGQNNLHERLNALEGPEIDFDLTYSDDTTMTKSIAESLVEKQKLDEMDIAKRFTDDYYKDIERGYALGVIRIFTKWQASDFNDLWGPAKAQFSGNGSYGNGSAMRIAPVALYFRDNYNQLLSAVTNVTKLTHTNPLGICGALFQSIAIQQALELDPREKLDVKLFLRNLRQKIEAFEKNISDKRISTIFSQFFSWLKTFGRGVDPSSVSTFHPNSHAEDIFPSYGFGPWKNWYYRESIDIIEKLLDKCRLENVSSEEVVNSLGNSVNALYSVPTALFCFLRSLEKIPHIETDNPIRRTIEYAVSLGGDSDTIASMAAAIAGSYYGEAAIPPSYLKHVEAGVEIPLLGEKLYDTYYLTLYYQ